MDIYAFKNDPCTTTGTGNLGGTCMTSSECASKSGSASGNCAAGNNSIIEEAVIYETFDERTHFNIPFFRIWSVLSFCCEWDV